MANSYIARFNDADSVSEKSRILREINSKTEKVTLRNRSFLQTLLDYLKADSLPRVVDESSDLLQLHLHSLRILTKSNLEHALTEQRMIRAEDVSTIFDLLDCDTNESHRLCCRNATRRTWSPEAHQHAKDILLGRRFQVVLESTDDGYENCELTEPESGESVVKLLSAHSDITHRNLATPFHPDRATMELAKVVHVLSPEWVYLQELEEGEKAGETLANLNTHLVDHYTALKESGGSPVEPGTTGDVIVKLRKDFVFRASVVRWVSGEQVVVFSLDYGWTVSVKGQDVFDPEDYLMETPALAKLARIQHVVVPSPLEEVQRAALRLLQTICSHRNSSGILNEQEIEILKRVLEGSASAAVVFEVLVLLLQMVRYNEHVSQMFTMPVLNTLKKWFLCEDVLLPGLHFLRELTRRGSNLEVLVRNGGVRLALRTFTHYPSGSKLHEFALAIIKRCMGDMKFISDSNTYMSLPVDGSDEGVTFTHLSYLSQYALYNAHSAQSLLDVNTSFTNFPTIAREIVACLNSPRGGVIYIGVDKQGMIAGVSLTRAQKDDFRNKLDSNIMKNMLGCHDGRPVPPSLVNSTFLNVENKHGTFINADAKFYVIQIAVSPSDVLCRTSGSRDDTIFWMKKGPETVPVDANQIRQRVARSFAGSMVGVLKEPDISSGASTISTTSDLSGSWPEEITAPVPLNSNPPPLVVSAPPPLITSVPLPLTRLNNGHTNPSCHVRDTPASHTTPPANPWSPTPVGTAAAIARERPFSSAPGHRMHRSKSVGARLGQRSQPRTGSPPRSDFRARTGSPPRSDFRGRTGSPPRSDFRGRTGSPGRSVQPLRQPRHGATQRSAPPPLVPI